MERITPVDYLLLLSLGLIWGAQFLFIEIAIAAVPPALVAAARIVVGAAVITLLARILAGRLHGIDAAALPPGLRPWVHFSLIGLFEATIPFFLMAWGQQHIHSSIAAILLGTVPLFTLALSALFVPGEGLRLASVIGVLLGFAGVAILIGPEAFSGFVADIAGELALLGASLSFAIAYVLIKLLPPMPLMTKARNLLWCASIQIVIVALIVDDRWDFTLTADALLAILALGALCSGIVFIPFVALINRAGPTFASLNNALIPPIGLLLGVVFLGEPLTWQALLAMAVIVLGLAAMAVPRRQIDA
ncbi:MAG: EamA family transporter [Alphaproteobacteria bacterium]|nr:EamA family transporter [Alphaproteobacteria bacterium]